MRRLLLVVGLLAWPALAFAQQAETIEYYGTDAIGSIRIVWDASGTVIARQDFTPFGEPVLQQGTAIPKEGFVGNETDANTSQDYFHARMFEARTGRFTRTDPIQDGVGEPQRWNRYVYALNNPLAFVDLGGTAAHRVPCAPGSGVYVCFADSYDYDDEPSDPYFGTGISQSGDMLVPSTPEGSTADDGADGGGGGGQQSTGLTTVVVSAVVAAAVAASSTTPTPKSTPNPTPTPTPTATPRCPGFLSRVADNVKLTNSAFPLYGRVALGYGLKAQQTMASFLRLPTFSDALGETPSIFGAAEAAGTTEAAAGALGSFAAAVGAGGVAFEVGVLSGSVAMASVQWATCR